MTRFSRVIAGALALACAAFSQTLHEAESLWKARRFQDANEVFRIVAEREPRNADCRVLWGRMFLEYDQAKDAAELFAEALKINPKHAGAWLGKALLAAEEFDSRAGQYAQAALANDPKLLEAQELLARLALEDNNNPKAVEEAKKALAIDAHSVQGKAILATIDWLADKKDTPWDPHAARGYETAGHFFMLNRRYDEAIEYYRKAIQLDPQLFSARSQLGINLMRLGREDEAKQQLELCYNNSFRDAATVNSLRLMDSYKNFVTFKTSNTILKLNKKEASLLHPYFEAEAQRAIDTYEKKYRLKLAQPVDIEVYPDHEDFAVRTLGVPGLGALGVTFGYSVVMDSPSGRPPGQFHWASTLWHEMSHVFTLTMTNHHVPRWFTEGLAVHEETAVSPEWGDRLGPDEIGAIKEKKLLPVSDLDRGFIHPTTPTQITISYFQAGKICDYINDKWGWDTLLAMLKDFGTGQETADVIRKQLKMEPAEFDKQFQAQLEASTKSIVEHFDQWKDGLKHVATLSKTKDYGAVIKEGTAIRDLFPDYVEEHSVYEALAQAYIAKDDKPAAISELERYVKMGGRKPETLKLAAKLLDEQGNRKEAAAVLDRLNYIYPMDNEAHQTLGKLYFELGNGAGAVREFRAVVAHNPLDPARAHYDLARALRLNHQKDQAQDELLAALEAAPGYREAQKLLLELNSAEPGNEANTVKK